MMRFARYLLQAVGILFILVMSSFVWPAILAFVIASLEPTINELQNHSLAVIGYVTIAVLTTIVWLYFYVGVLVSIGLFGGA